MKRTWCDTQQWWQRSGHWSVANKEDKLTQNPSVQRACETGLKQRQMKWPKNQHILGHRSYLPALLLRCHSSHFMQKRRLTSIQAWINHKLYTSLPSHLNKLSSLHLPPVMKSSTILWIFLPNKFPKLACSLDKHKCGGTRQKGKLKPVTSCLNSLYLFTTDVKQVSATTRSRWHHCLLESHSKRLLPS